MIVDHAALAEYNRVLVFLLTVQRAKFALDRAPRLAAHALLHTELHHFVSNLQVWRSTLTCQLRSSLPLLSRGWGLGDPGDSRAIYSMNAATEHPGGCSGIVSTVAVQ